MSIETISKRQKIIADLNAELNVLKDQYEDALLNDAEYQRAEEKLTAIKEESKELKDKVKNQILKKTTFTNILEDIKEKKEEIKNHKEIFSIELLDHYKETGETKVEDVNGNLKTMRFSVKLVN